MWTKKPWSTFFVMRQDKKSAACIVQTADKTKQYATNNKNKDFSESIGGVGAFFALFAKKLPTADRVSFGKDCYNENGNKGFGWRRETLKPVWRSVCP